MKKRSKNLQKIMSVAGDIKGAWSLMDALVFLKEKSFAKFDETVEIALCLGVDMRQSDQIVRGVCALPKGTGKKVVLAIFAKGKKAEEAKEAGADIVGAEDLVEKVMGGVIDFDRCASTPDMMPIVGRLGKVLGPRGMMPNPKIGTVAIDIASAVRSIKGGAIEFRADKTGIVHAGVGKVSFTQEYLRENIFAFVGAVQKARPSGAKGVYMKRMSVSSTMGIGLRVELSEFAEKHVKGA